MQQTEFTTRIKPQPINWNHFRNIILAAADVIESTKFNPSKKQEDYLIGLVRGEICRIEQQKLQNLKRIY